MYKRQRFASHGGYLLQGKELKAVQDIILKNGALNAAIVGQPAAKIAELAGFTVPATTKILIGEVTNVDESEMCIRDRLSNKTRWSEPRPAPRIAINV